MLAAFVVMLTLFMIFGVGVMTGSTMSGGVMGHGRIGGYSSMSVPTILTPGVGVLLGWTLFGERR